MTPSRDELIEMLVEDHINSVRDGGAALMDWVFRDGFRGFREYSDEALLGAARDAGLIDEEEPDEEPDDTVDKWPNWEPGGPG